MLADDDADNYQPQATYCIPGSVLGILVHVYLPGIFALGTGNTVVRQIHKVHILNEFTTY